MDKQSVIRVLWVLVLVVLATALTGCIDANVQSQRQETEQLQSGISAMISNQPVPNLGYSWEREQAIKLLLLLNEGYSTWTYTWQYGQLVEICPSVGYPFPYAVQITAPEVRVSGLEVTVPQPEPNSLYKPDSAEASWVLCVEGNGSVSPVYVEDRTITFPYRIKADRVIERYGGKDGESSVDMRDIAVPSPNLSTNNSDNVDEGMTNPVP